MLFPSTLLPISKFKWLFFGQQRSGHHAIMQWVLKGYQYIHYNACAFNKYNYVYSQDIITGTQGFYVANFEGSFPKKDWKSIQNLKCLILRNPYNMYASRLAMKRQSFIKTSRNLSSWDTCLDPQQWIEHAKEFLGHTSILGPNCIKINYDLWFSCENYRQDLAIKLQLKSNKLLQEMSCFGGGSSFDVKNKNVLERWKLFENDSEFNNILKNKEIKKLYNEIINNHN